jgi:hypothetical protein
MVEKVKPLETEDDDAGEDGKRQRSAIAFPYTDYENVEVLASAIHTHAGHGTCSAGQLAAWTDQSAKSSGFRTQISAARLFGVIEYADSDSLRLTDLGRRVLDPAKTKVSKAEAFLKVPLFKALYERYKDGVTPPAGALEREIQGLGVAEKQKARARQVFESSAQQTGFRSIAPNRLVMPAVVTKDEKTPDENKRKNGDGGDGRDRTGLNLDPLLVALLNKIPEQGQEWPAEKRLRWFKTFAMNVSQVYDPDDAPIELVIELKK